MTSGPGGDGPGKAGVTGLRRFVKRPPGAPAPGARAAAGPASVPLPGAPREQDPDAEYCEMCRTVLNNTGLNNTGLNNMGLNNMGLNNMGLNNTVPDDRHGHLVDIEKRSLACACRACYLLFTSEGAAGGRYRAVPERVCHDPDRPLTDMEWNELQIPVSLAFFFRNSALGRVVAGYPSPGGPTECELDLAAWDRLATTHPLLAEMAPDVEAILVNRADDEVFLIPIDECYSLIGELRLLWQGFDGGEEVRVALAAFLASLRRRAVVPERGR